MVAELVRLSVRCDEVAPCAVRRAISKSLDDEWEVGDAMLVASELVTNAVRHSLCTPEDSLTVAVSSNDALRISVLDPGGSGRNAEVANRPIDLGGLGLKVVQELSSRWGTDRRPDGYEVWAEIDRP